MGIINNKRCIAIIILLILLFTISLIFFKKGNKNISYDEYIDDIFVEEEKIEVFNANDIDNKIYIVAEIKGEVLKPDVYELEEGSIIKDLIDIAGGLTENADITNINRAKKLQNHELVTINNKDNPIKFEIISNIDTETDDMININSATIDQLKTISGIGDVKAKSIIEYREKNSGFKSIEEIKNIDGIGEKTFEKIKDKITL